MNANEERPPLVVNANDSAIVHRKILLTDRGNPTNS